MEAKAKAALRVPLSEKGNPALAGFFFTDR